jgi:hypothetical protein
LEKDSKKTSNKNFKSQPFLGSKEKEQSLGWLGELLGHSSGKRVTPAFWSCWKGHRYVIKTERNADKGSMFNSNSVFTSFQFYEWSGFSHFLTGIVHFEQSA